MKITIQIDGEPKDRMRLPQDRILHIDTELAGDEVRVVAEWQGELVRCKDCKYNLGETRSGRSILCNYCSHGALIERNKNWFCADGERREP